MAGIAGGFVGASVSRKLDQAVFVSVAGALLFEYFQQTALQAGSVEIVVGDDQRHVAALRLHQFVQQVFDGDLVIATRDAPAGSGFERPGAGSVQTGEQYFQINVSHGGPTW